MPLPQAEWYVKISGGYDRASNEAFNNCVMIANQLLNAGWTINAICGVLGNIEYESGYNPWRWESDDLVLSTETDKITSTSHGYGLFQFTPASKYIYSHYAQSYTGYGPFFLDLLNTPAVSRTDGQAQVQFVDEHADYIPTQDYPITYQDYKISMATPEELAATWLYNYERPGNPQGSITIRQESARYWFNILAPYVYKSGMPIWMMLRKRKF